MFNNKRGKRKESFSMTNYAYIYLCVTFSNGWYLIISRNMNFTIGSFKSIENK